MILKKEEVDQLWAIIRRLEGVNDEMANLANLIWEDEFLTEKELEDLDNEEDERNNIISSLKDAIGSEGLGWLLEDSE